MLNRADSGYGIRLQDVESSIGRKISHSVVSDGRTVVFALNRGVPFVVAARQARVSEDVVRMAKAVAWRRAGPDRSRCRSARAPQEGHLPVASPLSEED